MSLRLYFLGAPRFERDGIPAGLTASKAVALLAYLSAARMPQSRDRILALLWPESAGEAARKNLRNTLWAIRRALGEDTLLVDGDRLALAETTWVDTRALESAVNSDDQLADPVGDSPGPYLDGFTLAEAPDFELWLTAERERLGQLYLRALAAAAHRYYATGNWPGVADVARRALAHDNLQEPIHRLLMEAYARMGQRSDAIRQYEVLKQTLADELGVEPLPETEALRSTVLSGAFERQSVAGAGPAPMRPRRPPMLGDPPNAPFIGRAAERALLDAELEQARTGRTRVVLITGEMGIGKSRLWREWSAGVPASERVMEARCLEATQALPFAPLIDLFGTSACLRQLVTQPSQVTPIWLAEVARVIPALRTSLPDLPAPVPMPIEEERRRLFEAFAQFILALKATPAVLFMDDLHWADSATLDWLGYLVHRLREHGLLLVGAYRLEDAPAALARLVASWGREGIVQRLPLLRLTDDESRALVVALGGGPDIAQRLQSHGEGNPYFLIELCRSTPSDVPVVLSELIRSRLDRLPETSRQVLQATGILEPEFDFATLRYTSGRGEEETLDALDALLSAGVLVEHGGQYAFSHALVGTVVRAGLSQARRAFLHRRAAEAIERVHAGHLDVVAVQLTAHYAGANEPVRAALYADAAAQRALGLAAPSEAIDLFRQALALDATPERQMNLGTALRRSNEIAEARAVFQDALQAFVARGDRHGAARACLELAGVSFPSGRFDEVLRWAEAGLSYLNGDADPYALAMAYFLLGAGRSQGTGSFDEAEHHLREAARLSTVHNLPDLASQSSFELGNLWAQRGDLARALTAYEDALVFARQARDPLQEVLAHNNYAYHALLMGDLETAHHHIEAALALADAHAIQMPRQYLYSTRGEIAVAERQWGEAESWFTRGIAEAEQAGNAVQVANYRANLGLVAQGRGDLDGALMQFESAQHAVANLPAPHLQTQIDLWLTELHLERGERVAADETLRRAEARMVGKDYGRLRTWATHIRGRPKLMPQ